MAYSAELLIGCADMNVHYFDVKKEMLWIKEK